MSYIKRSIENGKVITLQICYIGNEADGKIILSDSIARKNFKDLWEIY
ncbi:MAG: hypothetical protein SCARUB_01527 [Candidatus Scalindua rubra]|uniref:Uncharacterized protein n=1 Tax=Candidatus Scalindua rubra TaxID=1872076 RepID=A0A1E3XCH1_9BACT|nr:MAG: hypothetical protein SCARUB_01527 [Candidatus Scalindua rubra]